MIDGGSGSDAVDYSASSDLSAGIVVHADGRVAGGSGTDWLSHVENIVGTSFADVLLGFGDHAANTLIGGQGDDFFDGRGGADTLDGGAGWDSVSYTQSDAGVFVNLMTGKGPGGDAEGNTLVPVENVFGTQHNDVVFGGAERNYLSGRDGPVSGKAGAQGRGRGTLVAPERHRQAVEGSRGKGGLSERHASRIVGQHRDTPRDRPGTGLPPTRSCRHAVASRSARSKIPVGSPRQRTRRHGRGAALRDGGQAAELGAEGAGGVRRWGT